MLDIFKDKLKELEGSSKFLLNRDEIKINYNLKFGDHISYMTHDNVYDCKLSDINNNILLLINNIKYKEYFGIYIGNNEVIQYNKTNDTLKINNMVSFLNGNKYYYLYKNNMYYNDQINEIIVFVKYHSHIYNSKNYTKNRFGCDNLFYIYSNTIDTYVNIINIIYCINELNKIKRLKIVTDNELNSKFDILIDSKVYLENIFNINEKYIVLL